MRSLRTIGSTVLVAVAALSPGAGVAAIGTTAAPIPQVLAPQRHDLSVPASSFGHVPDQIPPVGGREETDSTALPPTPAARAVVRDRVVQSALGGGSAPSPAASFDGIDSSNGASPPDPNGAVGPSDYVQAVNDSFEVFDKRGHRLFGPASVSSLWTGFGGACEESGRGDPVVLYDPFADRFVLSEFAYAIGADSRPTGPYYECIAVTKTSDPTADWYRYAFLVSATKLDDYPKLGVWPDGYYMTMNQFAQDGSWGGVGVAVFDRAAMVSGRDASMIYLDSPVQSNGLLPAVANGWTPPPAGSPEYFLGFDMAQWGHALDLYRWHVDWGNPAASSFSGPSVIPVAPFDADLCGYQRDCIRQPGTADGLDANSYRLMYPLTYRNLGDHQSLVVNDTVDVDGTDHGGIRWYEIRDPAGTPSVYQQGTYAPDAASRFTGSAAMDRSGDIAVGYTVSGQDTYPSVRYAGRVASDPPGELPQGEGSLMDGTGSQTDPTYRWGDYSSMSVDPSDDCTFWYTNEYYQTTNPWTWSTRIGSFRFPGCGPTGPALSIDDVAVQPGGAADFTVSLSPPSSQPASVSYSTQPGSAGAGDFTSTSGTLQFDPGQTTATVSVPVTSSGRRASSFSVVLSNPSGAEIGRIRGTASIDGTGGGSTATSRPDGVIRGPNERFAGEGVYNTTGRRQTRLATLARGVTRVFVIRVENHGATADRFRVGGPHGTPALRLQYRTMWSSTNITRRVLSGREILVVPRHSRRAIRLFVTATRRAWPGLRKSFLVVARSMARSAHRDAVRAAVRVVRAAR